MAGGGWRTKECLVLIFFLVKLSFKSSGKCVVASRLDGMTNFLVKLMFIKRQIILLCDYLCVVPS